MGIDRWHYSILNAYYRHLQRYVRPLCRNTLSVKLGWLKKIPYYVGKYSTQLEPNNNSAVKGSEVEVPCEKIETLPDEINDFLAEAYNYFENNNNKNTHTIDEYKEVLNRYWEVVVK